MKSLFSYLKGIVSVESTSRRSGKNGRLKRFGFENLEDRRLLAVTLDPTFGDDGIVTTNLGTQPSYDIAYDVVATQADGKILVTGRGGNNNFTVVRYNTDGSLDTSFDDDGKAVIDFGSNGVARSIAVDANGKIVVGGYSYQGSSYGYDFAVARLNTDGSLDTTFGDEGLATIGSSVQDYAGSMAIDSAGRIVIGGYSNVGGIYQFSAGRFTADGSVDTSFSADGWTSFNVGYTSSFAYALEVDANDKVVLGGRAREQNYPSYDDFAIIRLDVNGTLDNSFDGDGIKFLDMGSGSESVQDLAVYQGKIIAAGVSGNDFAVARFNDNGSLDSSFGTGGWVKTDFGNSTDQAYGLAVEADGGIVVAGQSRVSNYYRFALAKYNSDGSLDNSFAGDGTVTTNLGGYNNYSYAQGVDIDANGRYVVVGSYRGSSSNQDFAVLRYNSNGSLDNDFGGNGFVFTDIGRNTYEYAESVTTNRPDGKILALSSVNNPRAFALVQYNEDGSLDSTFGTNGVVTQSFGSNAFYFNSMTVDEDGKILIAGYTYGGSGINYSDFAVARLNSDGSFDTSFDGDGKITIDFTGSNDYAYSIQVDSDGRIVVGGRTRFNRYSSEDFGVVRLNSNGSLDTSFDSDGKATVDFGGTYDFLQDLAIDSQDRIVMAGYSRQLSTSNDAAIARLEVDGSLDTSFDADGRALFDVSGGQDYIYGVTIDGDGKIAAVGSAYGFTGQADSSLIRLNDNGGLDTSFDGDGIATVEFSGGNDWFYDVVVDSDGKYVIAGEIETTNGGYDFGVARYNTDGSIDTSFDDGDGLITTDIGTRYDGAWRLALDSSGRIVVGGWDNDDIVITRYTESNAPPEAEDATFELAENSANGTSVGVVPATDPNGDSLDYSVIGGTGSGAFTVDSSTGEITVTDSTQLDYETVMTFTLEVRVDDGNGGTDTSTITIDLLNQASISGVVFVDVNENGLYDANEPGIDGILVELLDENGAATGITATTADGGLYLFEDLNPGTYQLHEVQPTGVDDSAEILGTLGGTVLSNDTMQVTVERTDAFDYAFAELGQEVTSGDTATIGFWQNKHGQALIAQGGTGLAAWLTDKFGNVFGSTFSDGVGGDDGGEVAEFYKQELFKRRASKSTGPAKVDAQFMATALATYFTSSNLAGDVAGSFGFNVTDTGIGTRVVNLGSSGAAFGVDDDSNLTIMQLLLATNEMTTNSGDGYTSIYDTDGDGVISPEEAALRSMANSIFGMINEDGDI